MPSALSKLINKANCKENIIAEEKFLDFKIVQSLLFLCQKTNFGFNDIEFEIGLLNFMLIFKNHVLTDSRLSFLGTNLAEDANGSETVQSLVDKAECNENQAFDVLA